MYFNQIHQTLQIVKLHFLKKKYHTSKKCYEKKLKNGYIQKKEYYKSLYIYLTTATESKKRKIK